MLLLTHIDTKALEPHFTSSQEKEIILSFFVYILLNSVNPASTLWRATIGPSAKRHLNGVSLTGRWLSAFRCLLERSIIIPYSLSRIQVQCFAFSWPLKQLSFISLQPLCLWVVKLCFVVFYINFLQANGSKCICELLLLFWTVNFIRKKT